VLLMDIDATFLPVAEDLIDSVFPTDIVYHQSGGKTFDPLTGTVTGADTDHTIKAGVLSRSRVEAGGPEEVYELSIWVHHGASGLGFIPTTGDSFSYDGVVWRVTAVDPTYSSKSLIASKLTARSA
jgi:hypothetical protein